MISPNDICVCLYRRGQHAADNEACPVTLGNSSNGYQNEFHINYRFVAIMNAPVTSPISEKKRSVECPCGIHRKDCEYHK
jgi:hypothetical protein